MNAKRKRSDQKYLLMIANDNSLLIGKKKRQDEQLATTQGKFYSFTEL